MVELDYDEKRHGLQSAATLRLLASEMPCASVAMDLRKFANRLDSKYGFIKEEKKIAIRQYIKKSGGTSSIPELREHFPWHVDLITHLVGEMENAQVLEYYDQPPAGSGRGRPARRIRLISRI